MSSLEPNKIFAAVLVAGITAMFGGFIARELIHPHHPEKDAVTIEGLAEGDGSAVAAPMGPQPILHLIATADAAQGEKLSKACAACHSFEKGEPKKVGPNLWNVVGGPRGAKADFEYSEGMKKMGGAWSYADLNKFFYKPKSLIADTKMTYAGLKKAEDRAALIAWLRTKADSPDPMPSAAEIEAEAKELAPPAPAVAPDAAAPVVEGAAAPAEAATPVKEEPKEAAPVPLLPESESMKGAGKKSAH